MRVFSKKIAPRRPAASGKKGAEWCTGGHPGAQLLAFCRYLGSWKILRIFRVFSKFFGSPKPAASGKKVQEWPTVGDRKALGIPSRTWLGVLRGLGISKIWGVVFSRLSRDAIAIRSDTRRPQPRGFPVPCLLFRVCGHFCDFFAIFIVAALSARLGDVRPARGEPGKTPGIACVRALGRRFLMRTHSERVHAAPETLNPKHWETPRIGLAWGTLQAPGSKYWRGLEGSRDPKPRKLAGLILSDSSTTAPRRAIGGGHISQGLRVSSASILSESPTTAPRRGVGRSCIA